MDTTSFSAYSPSTSLINAPPLGITADEHARAVREGVQVTSENRCAYYNKSAYGAEAYKYLSPGVHNINWNPNPDLRVYEPGANNRKITRRKKSRRWKVDPQTWTNFKGHGSVNSSPSIQMDVLAIVNNPQLLGLVPMPIHNLAAAKFPRHRWAVSMGSFQHIINNKDPFIDYHEFAPGEAPYRFWDATGAIRSAIGIGRVRINLLVGPHQPGYHSEMTLDAVYCPGLPFSIFSLDMARWRMNMVYHVATWSLFDMSTERVVANTFQEEYTLFLRTNAR